MIKTKQVPKNQIKMKTSIFILLASGLVALARLGESNIEIANRYGPVQKREEDGTNTWNAGYLFKEYIVVVSFKDNKSQCEMLRPISDRAFTESERDALIKNIGGDGDWMVVANEPLFHSWVNSKTKAVAKETINLMQSSTLSVMTAEFAIKDSEASKQNEKSKANGF
jgi:hypothetical protein